MPPLPQGAEVATVTGCHWPREDPLTVSLGQLTAPHPSASDVVVTVHQT